MRFADLEGYNLSLQQARLWTLKRKSQAYHALCTISIHGTLDRGLFENVLQHVVQRHEILRTFFPSVPGIDVPIQMIADNHPVFICHMVDLQMLDAQCQKREVETWLIALRSLECDLEYAPLLRCWLVRLAGDHHLWLVSLPALCADVATLQLLVQEFQRLSLSSFQPEPSGDDPLQYADVSAWQNGLLQEEEAGPQQRYWQEKNFSLLQTLNMPFKRAQRSIPPFTTDEFLSSFAPQVVTTTLDNNLTCQILNLASTRGVSIEAFLLTCWQMVLWRLGISSHFLVGVACNGRIYEEMANALGLYTRFVPVDALFEKELPFEQLLADVAQALQEASERQAYFTWETAWLESEQSLNLPLFPLCFEYEYWPDAYTVNGLILSLQQRSSCFEPYFLKLSALQVGNYLQLELSHDRDHLVSEQAQSLLSALHALIRSVVEQPAARIGTLRLLASEEQAALVKASQATTRSLPEQTFQQLFEVHAAQHPQQQALVTAEECLTYQELNERANQLAYFLRRQRVGSGISVGLCVHRSAHMIICLLAILKAGGTYLPLDPEYPPARLTFQLQDTRAPILLTQQELAPLFSRWEGKVIYLEMVAEEVYQEARTNLSPLNTALDIAYVMYTSGSTGVPKGVCVRQQSVVNYTLALCELLQSQPGWHYATVSTLAADLGNTAIFCALASGGCLHVPDYKTVTSGEAFALWASQYHIDVLKIVPSHLSALLAAQQSRIPLPRQALVLGGEAFPASLLTLLRKQDGHCTIYNHYGPTEATIGALVNRVGEANSTDTYAELEAEGGTVPLGSPLTNCESYILDRGGQIVPIGVIGELYLGGMGLALGYIHRPELTAERFVPHPLSQIEGARLYRTGDLALYQPDGTIKFVGRDDEQVKLRGYRIELGEIEEQLRQLDGVREAVVRVWQEEGREPFLVGYIVPRQKMGLHPEELQQVLRDRIPEYMVPLELITLSQLPLTVNGKLDRQRLPMPSLKEEIGNIEELCTPVEEVIAGIWQDLLGIKKVGRTENFFQLGGHSLLGMRLIARLRAAFGVDLPVTELFASPTLAELAEHVEALVRGARQGAIPPLTAADRSEALPLSYAQQRLWFLHQLDPQNFSYNVPGAVRLKGSLDVAALQRSFKSLVQRQESLRTTFEDKQGQPIQRIAPEQPSSFTFIDLSSSQAQWHEAELQNLLQMEANKPFDLTCGPLCRALLLKLGQQDYVLSLTLHHIISDGWSISILVRELTTLYRAQVTGEPSQLEPLSIHYVDYAVWQRQWLQGEILREQIRYWTAQLSEAQAVELPGDDARSKTTSQRGARYGFDLDAELAHRLIQLSQQEGVTLFMTLLAALQILLARLSGQADIVVGTDSANRAHVATEKIIGFFINLLVLRTRINDFMPFQDLLRQVRETVLNAYLHQDLPFEMVIEHLRLNRGSYRTPLVRVLLVMQNIPAIHIEFSGLSVSQIDINTGTAKFDLALFVTEKPTGLHFSVDYSVDLFESSTIVKMMNHYKVLLQNIVAHPEADVADLEISSEKERQLHNRHRKKLLEQHLSKLKDFKGDFVNPS